MLLLHGRLLVGKRSIVYVRNELKLLGWNESLQEHNWHVQLTNFVIFRAGKLRVNRSAIQIGSVSKAGSALKKGGLVVKPAFPESRLVTVTIMCSNFQRRNNRKLPEIPLNFGEDLVRYDLRLLLPAFLLCQYLITSP